MAAHKPSFHIPFDFAEFAQLMNPKTGVAKPGRITAIAAVLLALTSGGADTAESLLTSLRPSLELMNVL